MAMVRVKDDLEAYEVQGRGDVVEWRRDHGREERRRALKDLWGL